MCLCHGGSYKYDSKNNSMFILEKCMHVHVHVHDVCMHVYTQILELS